MTTATTSRHFFPSDVDAEVVARPTMAWRSILGSVALAMSVQLVLTLLGAAIGFGAADANAIDDPVAALGIGVLVWGIVVGLVAYGLGGFIAGNMSTNRFAGSGAAHGLMVWAIAGLLGIILVTLGSAIVSSGAAAGAGNAAPRIMGISMDMPGLADRGTTGRSTDLTTTGRTATTDNTRTAAGSRVTDEEARAMADRAAKYTSRASLFAAISLIMGAVGAMLGGTMGRKAREKADGHTPVHVRA
jgi:hypothetical protein